MHTCCAIQLWNGKLSITCSILNFHLSEEPMQPWTVNSLSLFFHLVHGSSAVLSASTCVHTPLLISCQPRKMKESTGVFSYHQFANWYVLGKTETKMHPWGIHQVESRGLQDHHDDVMYLDYIVPQFPTRELNWKTFGPIQGLHNCIYIGETLIFGDCAKFILVLKS